MAWVVPFVLCVLFAAPAFAQSPYVAGAVGVDVSRFARTEGPGTDLTAGGEAAAFSLRLGTAIRDGWGVELDFTRPSEVERDVERGFPVPLLGGQPGAASMPFAIFPDVVFPIFESTIRLKRRDTTIDTVAWVAQAVSGRVDLVYLGGVAFSRVVEELDFQLSPRAGVFGYVVPRSTRTISYGVGPVVGVDARIDFTEHVMLVPGVRLHGVRGNAGTGWLLRSSVGLGWSF